MPAGSVASMDVLDPEAVAAGIAGLSWEHRDGELVKVRRGADFADSVSYVNAVAAAAESAGHHPDVEISWDTVTLRLSTHSAGGITDADLSLARRIETLP